MQVCMGALGWPPESFWAASVADCRRAVAGYRAARGLSARRPADPKALRRLIRDHAQTSASIRRAR